MKKSILHSVVCLAIGFSASAQIQSPDTVCINTPVSFSTPYKGHNYAWATIHNPISVQSPSNSAIVAATSIDVPASSVMCVDDGNYYAFTTNTFTQHIIRYSFGNNPNSTPTVTNLGNLGFVSGKIQCIDIVKDGISWYGFVADYQNLVRLDFGGSLANTPTATSMDFSGFMEYGMQVSIRKVGSQWVGFCGNSGNNNIVRFDFGNSITNTPTAYKLPNYNILYKPSYFTVFETGSSWHMLVTNLTDNRIARYDFGSSIMNNTPSCIDLGNPGSTLSIPRGINIIEDCNGFYGLVVNETGNFIKLDFQNNITNLPTATSLGPLNTTDGLALLSPYWYNDSLYLMSSSFLTDTIYRTPVAGLPAGADAKYQQSGYTYTFIATGVYDISLICNAAQPFNSRVFCKSVVVVDTPAVNITIAGNTLTATGTGNYQWALNGTDIPGAQGQSYTPTQSGTYSVRVTNAQGCTGSASFTYTVGIHNIDLNTSTLIYPNPTTGLVNIKSDITGNTIVSVFNTLGQIVKTQTKNFDGRSHSIDLTELPKGVYQLLLITDKGERFVSKITLR